MRFAELPWARSFLTELIQVIAPGIEMHDAVVQAIAVAFCNKNVAVFGIHHHIVGPVKQFLTAATLSSSTQCHQYFAIRIELEYLMPDFIIGSGIGYPEIALVIYRCSMGEQEQSSTEAGEQISVIVIFQNRIFRAILAGIFETAVHHINETTIR